MAEKQLKLDKHPIPLEPSFFIVVVASGVTPIETPIGMAGVANVEFYQSRCVAYVKQEAINAVMAQLQAEQPDLYRRGQSMGGWKVTHVDGINATDMENIFKERTNRERNNEENKRKIENNDLLKRIIDTKDLNLFHTALKEGRINHYERLYLHDILTEGLPKGADEQTKI